MTATADTNAIKDKIRKLMALAKDDSAFDGEVDNALRFANKLMQLHNFTEADLANPQGAHERAAKTEYGREFTASNGLKITAWEGYLALAICDLIGTIRCYNKRDKSPAKTPLGTVKLDANGQAVYSQHIVFYGPVEDCRDARHMFSEWSTLIIAMARMKTGTALRGPGRSYSEGFAGALKDKVKRIKQESLSLPGQNALVVQNANQIAEGKRQQAKIWLQQSCGIRLVKTQRAANNTDYGAYSQGRADGSRADFSRVVKSKLTGR